MAGRLLTGAELAVCKISRVQGPRMILKGLRALLIRNHRSMVSRADTIAEIQWSQRVHTLLSNLIEEGDATLPLKALPRKITHRARKRATAAASATLFVLLSCVARPAAAQDWSAAAPQLQDSIVRLVISRPEAEAPAICTGVIVNEPQGYVAAAAHCFPTNPLGSSIAANGRHAERIRINYVLDLAVIQVKGLHGHAARLRATPAGVGLPIALVGYAFGAQHAKTLFGWISDHADESILEARLLMDADAIGGMSGGGIFDAQGELVSLVGGSVFQFLRPGRLTFGAAPQILLEFLKPFIGKP